MESLLNPTKRSFWETLAQSLSAMGIVMIGLTIFLLAGLAGVALISPLMWFFARLDGDNPRTRSALIRRADEINARKAAEQQDPAQ